MTTPNDRIIRPPSSSVGLGAHKTPRIAGGGQIYDEFVGLAAIQVLSERLGLNQLHGPQQSMASAVPTLVSSLMRGGVGGFGETSTGPRDATVAPNMALGGAQAPALSGAHVPHFQSYSGSVTPTSTGAPSGIGVSGVWTQQSQNLHLGQQKAVPTNLTNANSAMLAQQVESIRQQIDSLSQLLQPSPRAELSLQNFQLNAAPLERQIQSLQQLQQMFHQSQSAAEAPAEQARASESIGSMSSNMPSSIAVAPSVASSNLSSNLADPRSSEDGSTAPGSRWVQDDNNKREPSNTNIDASTSYASANDSNVARLPSSAARRGDQLTEAESDPEETARNNESAGYAPQKGNPNSRVSQAAQWERRLRELTEYRERFGDCLVPHNYSENIPLALWVKRQRYQHRIKYENRDGKPSVLTDEREAALNELGFVWDAHEDTWEEKFEQLVDFRARYGHCSVPITVTDKSDKQLAIWVKCQRRQYQLLRKSGPQASSMTQGRIDRLESLGFVWRPRNNKKTS